MVVKEVGQRQRRPLLLSRKLPEELPQSEDRPFEAVSKSVEEPHVAHQAAVAVEVPAKVDVVVRELTRRDPRDDGAVVHQSKSHASGALAVETGEARIH